jgi:hypothetical protein
MGRQWTAGIAKAKELIQTDYIFCCDDEIT